MTSSMAHKSDPAHPASCLNPLVTTATYPSGAPPRPSRWHSSHAVAMSRAVSPPVSTVICAHCCPTDTSTEFPGFSMLVIQSLVTENADPPPGTGLETPEQAVLSACVAKDDLDDDEPVAEQAQTATLMIAARNATGSRKCIGGI